MRWSSERIEELKGLLLLKLLLAVFSNQCSVWALLNTGHCPRTHIFRSPFSRLLAPLSLRLIHFIMQRYKKGVHLMNAPLS